MQRGPPRPRPSSLPAIVITSMPCLADDRDRAGRIEQHGLGDGAEAHLVDAAAAARPDHEQLGVGRRGEQGRARGAGQHPPDHADPGVLLRLYRHDLVEVLFYLVTSAEPAGGVGQRAHGHQRHAAQRGLLEGEDGRGLAGRGAVRAQHDRAGDLVGGPPRAADDDHRPGSVPGHLPGDGPEPQAGQLAVPAAADHHHVGGAAALA
jgi:hypothetical protein